MKLKYVGSNTAIQFSVGGKILVLAKGNAIDITDAQAKSLQERNYVKALIKKGLLEFIGTKPTDAKPDSDGDAESEKALNDYNKDELLDMAKELGIDGVNARTGKGDIIKAIEEARK